MRAATINDPHLPPPQTLVKLPRPPTIKYRTPVTPRRLLLLTVTAAVATGLVLAPAPTVLTITVFTLGWLNRKAVSTYYGHRF